MASPTPTTPRWPPRSQAYLASVVGPGNADVQVNATLDYSQVSTTTNSIQVGPDGQAAELLHPAAAEQPDLHRRPGRPPAVRPVLSPPPQRGAPAPTRTRRATNTCETSEQTQTVQQAPGTLKSEQVAVLVNSKAIPGRRQHVGPAGRGGRRRRHQRARGDQLAFSTMPFNSSSATASRCGQGGRRRQPEQGHGVSDQDGDRVPHHRPGAVPAVALGQEGQDGAECPRPGRDRGAALGPPAQSDPDDAGRPAPRGRPHRRGRDHSSG